MSTFWICASIIAGSLIIAAAIILAEEVIRPSIDALGVRTEKWNDLVDEAEKEDETSD